MLLNNYKISLNFSEPLMKVFLIKSNKVKYKVAQRVLCFKKKTRLTVLNIHSNLLNSRSVYRPLSAGGDEPLTKFSKRGAARQNLNFYSGFAGKEGVTLFRWRGCNFHIKINQNIKIWIFNGKKSSWAKMFFSVITKNSNWEISPKNLVTFKR